MIGTSVGAAAPLITVNRTVCPPIVTVITAAPAPDVVTPICATRSPTWTTTGPCTVATFGLLLDATPTRSATAGAPSRRTPMLAAVLRSRISTPACGAAATPKAAGRATIGGTGALPVAPTLTVKSRTSPPALNTRDAMPSLPVTTVTVTVREPAWITGAPSTRAIDGFELVTRTGVSAGAGVDRSNTSIVNRLAAVASNCPAAADRAI